MKKIVVTLLLFISFIGYSQTNGITYQAVILNPSGDQLPGVNNTNAPLVNKEICLKFSIIDQNSQFEYIETVQTTTDEFGMVNLIIGTGDQIGGYTSSFSTILWNANPKSLKVDLSTTGVCSDYTEISNQPFTAVPFALFAATAGTPGTPGPAGPQGIQGVAGPTGATGATGPVGPQGPIGLTGATGSQGLPGIQGVAGPTGATGAIGPVGPQGAQGIAGSNGTNGVDGAVGATGLQGLQGIQGPVGPIGAQGLPGTNGTNGSSAYQVALTNGFVGSESQWLASLAGATGATGAAGTNGTNGSSAFQVAVTNGFVGTEAQWLASLVGTQGPAGATGLTGPQGIAGTNGSDATVTIGAINSTSDPKGATITAGELKLAPADASNGGIVTTGTQTFSGNKEIIGNLKLTGILGSETLDQSSSGQTGGTGAYISLWQSFTAGISGSLSKITMLFYNTQASGTLYIYQGTGTNGTLLTSQPFSVSTNGAYDLLENFSLVNPPNVISGSIYTMAFIASSGTLWGGTTNDYNRGVSYYGDTPSSNSNSSENLYFKTFVSQSGGSVSLAVGEVTYPSTHGTTGQVLTTNGSGALSWSSPSAGSSITLGSISTSSNQNGATITAGELKLAPADASNGGIVTTGTQTFGGSKIFSSDILVNGITVGNGAGNEFNTKLNVLGSASFRTNVTNSGLIFDGYSPSGSLEVSRIYTDATSGTPSDFVLGTYPNAHSNQLYLKQSNGFVGIKTANPTTALDVNGTVTATSFIKRNGLSTEYLMADGSVSNGSSTTVGAINSTSDPKGATITAGELKLAPADATNGGIVTTGTQTFGGSKTFNSNVIGNLSGNATTATNIAGGSLGQIPYQNSSNTTSFLPADTSTSRKFLSSIGSNGNATAPTWQPIRPSDIISSSSSVSGNLNFETSIFGSQSWTELDTQWNITQGWANLRDYNGTAYQGSYSINAPDSQDFTLQSSKDFNLTSLFIMGGGMNTATSIEFKGYTAAGVLVGSVIVNTSAFNFNFSNVNLNFSGIRKLVYHPIGFDPNAMGGGSFFLDYFSVTFSTSNNLSSVNGILKSNGNGEITAAVSGTDFLAPTGSAAGLTNFPTLNQNTTGTAANVSGVVAIANGGTAATTAAEALTNLGAAPIDSPTFTGVPLAPTATAGISTTQIATTAFVTNAVSAATSGAFVDLTSVQTVAGAKTFSSDIVVNGLTIGKGTGQNGDNTAIGAGALNSSNANGTRNTAVGASALLNYIGTSFDNNTGVGYSNMAGLTTGDGNTSVGAETMFSVATGSNNTGIGNQSLISTSGNNNVGVGTRSGDGLTTGSNNTFLGTQAKTTSVGATVSNATAIGYAAEVGTDNTIQLGNTSVTNVNTSGFYTGSGFKTPTGTSTQYLMADGSVSSVSTGSTGPQILTETQRDALNLTSSGTMIFNSTANQYQGSVYYTTGYNYNYFTTINYGFSEIRPGHSLTQTFTGKGQVITSANIAVVNMGRVSNTGDFTFAIWDETYQYPIFSTTITLSGAGTVSVTIPNDTWNNMPRTLPNGLCSFRISSDSGTGGSADFLMNAGASVGSLSNSYWSSLGGTPSGYTTPTTTHQLAIDLFPQNGLTWVSFN